MSEITKKLESITSRILLLRESHHDVYRNVIEKEVNDLNKELADIEGSLSHIEEEYEAAIELNKTIQDIADFHPNQSASRL